METGKKTPATTPCPSCSNPVRETDTFCEECGVKLTRLTCPRCGTESLSAARFCESCGTDLKMAAEPLPPAIPVAGKSSSPPPPPPLIATTPPIQPVQPVMQSTPVPPPPSPIPAQESPVPTVHLPSPLPPPPQIHKTVVDEPAPRPAPAGFPGEPVNAAMHEEPPFEKGAIPPDAYHKPEPEEPVTREPLTTGQLFQPDQPHLPIPEKPVVPAPLSVQKGLRMNRRNVIAAFAVLVIIGAAYIFMLPHSGDKTLQQEQLSFPSLPFGGNPQQAAVTATHGSGSSGGSQSTGGTGSLSPLPTQTLPLDTEVSVQVDKSAIDGSVTVILAGGQGRGVTREITVQLTRADGQVLKGSLRPDRNINEVTLAGTKQTDRIEVIVIQYSGQQYRLIDQLLPYRTRG